MSEYCSPYMPHLYVESTTLLPALLGISSDEGYYDISGNGKFDITDLVRIKKLAAA